MAWLSVWSSETQAAEYLVRSSHSVSNVVLPNPAGAETSVNFDSAPKFRRVLNLGRATRPRRRRGT